MQHAYAEKVVLDNFLAGIVVDSASVGHIDFDLEHVVHLLDR